MTFACLASQSCTELGPAQPQLVYLRHCVTSVTGVCKNVLMNDLENDESKNIDKVFLEESAQNLMLVSIF